VNARSAIAAIDRAGALLVFPLDNRDEPESLWSHFYPEEDMTWEWDDDGDDRVAKLWHLRGDLSTTRKVVYTKWFRGRATYLSRAIFAALLRALNPAGEDRASLSSDARRILSILESESPLSTKELKRQAELAGRANEGAYGRALKELWSRLLIVAFGEVEDGAFPSLAIGATRVLYEDLWEEAFSLDPVDAESRAAKTLGRASLFFKHYAKLRASAGAGPKAAGTQGVSGKKRRAPKPGSVIRFEDL
jgi:hypothetical protein